MLENKKRDQHYVFQAYLKNWVNTNGKLWCMRDGKVFDVKTSNIAFEKDFYRVNSLSNKDIEFIKLFFYKSSDAFKKEMDYFLKLYTTIDRDEKIFELIFKLCTKDISEISEAIDDINKMIDIARNNIMEEVYCDFEGEACDWLKNLCKEDIDFLYTSSKEEKEKFISFVCSQYFRTKRMKEHMMYVLKEAEKFFVNKEFPQGSIKAENLYQPMLWLLSAKCSDKILNAHITLIINRTDVPFITSDQPVINLKADYKDFSNQPDELVFYYPISPRVAVRINDDLCVKKIELTNSSDIYEYNDLINRAAYKMIFSKDKSVISKYIA